MKLKEIGEFGFIERIKPLFNSMLDDHFLGIGDDCSVIPKNDEEDFLITTDLLMEDVHFLRNVISAKELGFKSLAVSLSDIAAMGGNPVGSFLSIAVPSDIEVDYLDCFMEGYQDLSQRYNTPLLGGDTTGSLKHLAINVCVIGTCAKGNARLRKYAQVGDVICVTGPLGDSSAGLKGILENSFKDINFDYLIKKHFLPEPRIPEGKFLSRFSEVHAMIDISDGIASDLNHIVKASGVQAKLQLNNIPISENLSFFAGKINGMHWILLLPEEKIMNCW